MGLHRIDKNMIDRDFVKAIDKVIKKSDEVVSLMDFDAVGDGVADDTKPLQDAISYINSKGGGTLVIPRGTFMIKPLRDKPIQLCSNLRMVGLGNGSILKVHPETGDYWAIFGQTLRSDPLLENMTFENFRIDQNPTANINVNMAVREDTESWRQFSFSLWNFENIHFNRIVFSPTTGVNTITCNNPNTGKNVTIENCTFHFARSNGNPDYDNSAIYVNCLGAIVKNNKFYCGVGLGARGCIETHGGHSVVEGNYSEGYYTGVNIVNRSQTVPSDITIVGNTFTRARSALQLWVLDDALENVTIADNTISIDLDRFTGTSFNGITSAGSHGSGQGLKNINITGNSIYFVGGTDSSVGSGIDFRLQHIHDGIHISGNMVYNAPSFGVSLGSVAGGRLDNVFIKGNFLKNCSYTTETASNPSFISVSGTCENTVIEQNFIRDNFDESKAMQAIRMISGTFKDCYIKGNHVSAKNGSLWIYLQSDSFIKDRTSFHIVDSLQTNSLVKVKKGDTVIDSSSPAGANQTYRVGNDGVVGSLKTSVTATYDSVNKCYIFNTVDQLSSGVWLGISGLAVVITHIRGNKVYVSGGYDTSAVNVPVTLRNPRLQELDRVYKSDDGSLWKLTIDNTGALTTTKL